MTAIEVSCQQESNLDLLRKAERVLKAGKAKMEMKRVFAVQKIEYLRNKNKFNPLSLLIIIPKKSGH